MYNPGMLEELYRRKMMQQRAAPQGLEAMAMRQPQMGAMRPQGFAGGMPGMGQPQGRPFMGSMPNGQPMPQRMPTQPSFGTGGFQAQNPMLQGSFRRPGAPVQSMQRPMQQAAMQAPQMPQSQSPYGVQQFRPMGR